MRSITIAALGIIALTVFGGISHSAPLCAQWEECSWGDIANILEDRERCIEDFAAAKLAYQLALSHNGDYETKRRLLMDAIEKTGLALASCGICASPGWSFPESCTEVVDRISSACREDVKAAERMLNELSILLYNLENCHRHKICDNPDPQ